MRQFELVNSTYGAPMGRREFCYEPESKIALFRVRLSGGYDDGGAYWGSGTPLFCARDDSGSFRVFVRARSRKAAGEAIMENHDVTREQFKRPF